MKTVWVEEPGGADLLGIVEMDAPVPREREVLVRVYATALNRADIYQREGKYTPPEGESRILGLEAAGIVTQVGSDVNRWRPGDRVFGLLGGGGYAEYVAFHEDLLMAIPRSITFLQAAAIPEAFLTAFQALVLLGRVEEGETVLIHAGGSGVGTAAIQLTQSRGALAIVTASRSKHDACLSLGAKAAIDYNSVRFEDEVDKLTKGSGADLIVDFIGAPYLEANIEAAAVDGRIVLLALMGGADLANFRMAKLFRKRLTIIASTLRNRTVDYKARLVDAFRSEVLPDIARGSIQPVIDTTFGLDEVVEAHRRMESNRNVGKIVLTVAEESS